MAQQRLVIARFHETDEYIASTLPGPVEPPDQVIVNLTVDSPDANLFDRLVEIIHQDFTQRGISIENL